jgi:predicted ThiF/HesA family dinucleotide-utilizing enzyme
LVVFKVINLKRGKGKPMAEVIREGVGRVGVDLAKRVIQVHMVDAHERVDTTKALRREQFLPWCARLPGVV